MKTKITNGIITIAAAFFASFILAPQMARSYSYTYLPVPLAIQEESNWCWAASSQAILQFYGTLKEQCTMADFAFGATDCCTFPDSCNVANYLYHTSDNRGVQDILTSLSVSGYFSVGILPWDYPVPSVQSELKQGTPFISAIGRYNGTYRESGHEVVVYEFMQFDDGDKIIFFMSPGSRPEDPYNTGSSKPLSRQ